MFYMVNTHYTEKRRQLQPGFGKNKKNISGNLIFPLAFSRRIWYYISRVRLDFSGDFFMDWRCS